MKDGKIIMAKLSPTTVAKLSKNKSNVFMKYQKRESKHESSNG
jgi:hypothetical protein